MTNATNSHQLYFRILKLLQELWFVNNGKKNTRFKSETKKKKVNQNAFDLNSLLGTVD